MIHLREWTRFSAPRARIKSLHVLLPPLFLPEHRFFEDLDNWCFSRIKTPLGSVITAAMRWKVNKSAICFLFCWIYLTSGSWFYGSISSVEQSHKLAGAQDVLVNKVREKLPSEIRKVQLPSNRLNSPRTWAHGKFTLSTTFRLLFNAVKYGEKFTFRNNMKSFRTRKNFRHKTFFLRHGTWKTIFPFDSSLLASRNIFFSCSIIIYEKYLAINTAHTSLVFRPSNTYRSNKWRV